MKRFYLFCLCALFAFCALPARAQETTEVYTDIARIQARGYLIAARPSFDVPALFEGRGDQSSGADLEVSQGLAEALGVDIVYDCTADSWDALTARLCSGEVDIAVGCFSNSLDRARTVAFSDAYLSVNYGLLCNLQALVRYDVEDNPLGYLKEKHAEKPKIGVEANSAHVPVAERLFPECEIVPIAGDGTRAGYQVASKMVRDGELFAFFNNELQFLMLFAMDKELAIYAKAFSFTDIGDQYCIGLPKESEGLLRFTNIYLSQMQKVSMDDITRRFMEYYGGEGA